MSDHAERDVRNIRACSTHAELDAYEAAAKLRGIEPHELAAIYEHRRAMTKRGVRT